MNHTSAEEQLLRLSHTDQGCQIFLDTIYQNGTKRTQLQLNGQMAIMCIFQMSIEYTVPTFSIPRPTKIYPNWYFWFVNISSGNPDTDYHANISTLCKFGRKEGSEIENFPELAKLTIFLTIIFFSLKDLEKNWRQIFRWEQQTDLLPT
jgi:hypothetical protein